MNTPDIDDKTIGLRGTNPQDRLIERPSWMRRHRKLAAAVCVTVLVLGGLLVAGLKYAGNSRAVDRARLTIATVERGSFARDTAADGQVVAAVSPTLYASAAGTVSLKVHAGDEVTKGQILAALESPDLAAKLSQEQATLDSARGEWRRAELDAARKLRQLQDAYQQAQVDRTTAQREFERSSKAYELGSYSEMQVLRAQDALEKAQFSFQQAKIDYESQPEQNRFDISTKKSLLDRQQFLVSDLARQVDDLTLRSPVDGQVGQVQVADRASVAKDTALLTVVDLSALEVEIKVPETFARDLKPGMTAHLEGGGRRWRGSVGGVSPQVVHGEVTARVRFGTEEPAGLRQSQRISVRIMIERRENVLMIDRGSLTDQEGSSYAYVLHGDVAERQRVHFGTSSISKIEILDGSLKVTGSSPRAPMHSMARNVPRSVIDLTRKAELDVNSRLIDIAAPAPQG